MTTPDPLIAALRSLLAEFRSPENGYWLTSACADRLEAVLTEHAPPEVGSCANQLAGWLRTQHSIETRLRATIERELQEHQACVACSCRSDIIWFHQGLHWVLRTLEAMLAARVSPPDDVTRCSICGWTLADSVDKGCVRGNCSMRPFPERAYAPARANAEYGGVLAGRYGIPDASRGGGDPRPPLQEHEEKTLARGGNQADVQTVVPHRKAGDK